ncbi:hypothetical protein GOV14_07015 [Candidatus Pacearchaeota archaeon]|nr:hypothetical protein [Candidatus Pacearchaeota archaeon]
MVNKTETLKRLNKEKNYEEKITKDISYYLIDRIDLIKDLSEMEKNVVIEKLSKIATSEIKHSQILSDIIQLVMETEKDQF